MFIFQKLPVAAYGSMGFTLICAVTGSDNLATEARNASLLVGQ